MYLDIDRAPREIVLGSPITKERGNLYAALLEQQILPVVARRAQDTAFSFLQRCADALARSYADIPLTVQIVPHGDTVGVGVWSEQPAVVDATHFHERLTAHDRILCASLFGHLERASHPALNVFTAGTACTVVEWMRFGDLQMWWDELRDQLANDTKAQTVTNFELRKHVRETGIVTPGMLFARLGAHHARIALCKRTILSIEQCEERIIHLPRSLRAKAHAILTASDTLTRCSKAMETRSALDGELWDTFGRTANPAILIETTHTETVCELYDELWEYTAQSEEMGPHYAFALRPNTQSLERFSRTLSLFAQAWRALEKLATLLHEDQT